MGTCHGEAEKRSQAAIRLCADVDVQLGVDLERGLRYARVLLRGETLRGLSATDFCQESALRILSGQRALLPEGFLPTLIGAIRSNIFHARTVSRRFIGIHLDELSSSDVEREDDGTFAAVLKSADADERRLLLEWLDSGRPHRAAEAAVALGWTVQRVYTIGRRLRRRLWRVRSGD